MHGAFPRASRSSINRALVPAGLILVCCIILGLALTKRTHAPIDLSARAEGLTLHTAGYAVELPPFRVSRIAVIGEGAVDGVTGATAFQSAIEVARPANAASGGLSLAGLTLPPRSKLTLRRQPGVKGGYEFVLASVREAERELRVFAEGPMEVSTDGQRRTMPTTDIASLDLAMGSSAFVLRLTLTEDEWSIQRPFAIASLDFRDTDTEGDPAGLFSALKGGSVSFLDVEAFDGGDRRMELLPRQMLTIGAISEGYVRNLAITESEITFGMTGEVADLRTVWKATARDHMPTLLATLSSNDWINKLAVFALAVFAALLPLIYGRTRRQ